MALNAITSLTTRLGLAGPLIQAPMAGGATTPELVATVSNAGALGSLGGAYLSPSELEKDIQKIKALTQRPFAVNLFAPCPEPVLNSKQVAAAMAATRSYREALGIPDPVLTPPFAPNFAAQIAIVLSERPAVFSFTFGVPDRKVLEECRHRGILTFGTATNLEEAMALETAAVDAVVAQGAEAGAQRGSFSAERDDAFIGLVPLVTSLVARLRTPVIASGGIMNGHGIAAALAMGAQAAQLGTAFLACEESGINQVYKDALLDPNRKSTRATKAFTGRWARGLENKFMLDMAQKESTILPFPAQNALTQDIRKIAAQQKRPEFLSLWAGQGVALIRSMKAEALVSALLRETTEVIENIAAATKQV